MRVKNVFATTLVGNVFHELKPNADHMFTAIHIGSGYLLSFVFRKKGRQKICNDDVI
jgi:hypothetical protein